MLEIFQHEGCGQNPIDKANSGDCPCFQAKKSKNSLIMYTLSFKSCSRLI